MASTIDLNKLYNYYLNKYGDKRTAAQYTAFQYLSNPSGSVAGLKEPQKYYSQDEWLSYEAPAYLAIKNYNGTDPTNLYVSAAINKSNNLAELQTELRRVGDTLTTSKTSWLYDPAYSKVPKDFRLGKNSDITTNDLINQVGTFWSQKESAEKKYKNQQDTHPYAQFGLGDPNLRYTVFNVSDALVSPGTKQMPVAKYPTNKYVQYKPGVDYITKATSAFGNNISAKYGISGKQLATYSKQFQDALSKAVQAKLDASPLSPFVDQVKALRPIRKP